MKVPWMLSKVDGSTCRMTIRSAETEAATAQSAAARRTVFSTMASA